MYLLGRPKFRGDEEIAPAEILKSYCLAAWSLAITFILQFKITSDAF
jgi:hypothetical protein